MILFIILIAGISNLILGSLVLYKLPSSKTARLFFLFTVAAAVWIFTNFLWLLTHDYLWLKATYGSGIAFVLSGLFWVYSLTGTKIPVWHYMLYSVGFALAIASLMDNMVVVLQPNVFHNAKSFIVYNSIAIGEGILFNALSVFMFVAMALILIRLHKGVCASEGLKKIQIKYLFISGLFFMTLVFLFDFLLPSLFHTSIFAFVDSPLSLLLIAVFAYTTLRFRLMNVQVLIRKGFVYIALALFSYAAFHLTAWFLLSAFGSLWTLTPLTLGFIIALIFALSFRYVYQFAIYLANHYLYANIYNGEETFRNLTDRLAAIVDMDVLARTIADAITNTFTVQKIAIVLTKGGLRVMAKRAVTVSDIHTIKRALPLLKSVSELLIIKQSDFGGKYDSRSVHITKELNGFFESMGIQLIIPLMVKGHSHGVILIGAKKADRPFTSDDFILLDTLSKQASIAVDNALLYQDLGKKNVRLKNMLSLQKEFLDIASHQLRTPISIMRGATSLLASSNNALTVSEAIPLIYDAAVRMNSIVDTILLASKVGMEKFKIQPEWLKSIAIAPLIDEVVHGFRYSIQNNKAEISVVCPEDAHIFAYDRYVTIVLENLIGNALKYSMRQNTIPKVQVYVENTGKVFRIRVIDNGVGVPAQDKERLFHKFARGANVTQKFPDGTGLGLFIIKKIVGAHPLGKTGLKSVEGDGSEFWVEFKKVSK